MGKKAEAKRILRTELEKIAAQDFQHILKKAHDNNGHITYALSTYQVTLSFDVEQDKVINVLGAIDGPGVTHFLGIISSLTDFFSIDEAGVVQFKEK